MMELSTPLNEVMDQQVMAPPVAPQAPAQQMQLQLPPQQMSLDTMVGPQPQAPPQPQQESKNPGGLTDEQMDALLAGLVAGVAFSPQFKEMLARYVPSLFDESGARTVGGMAATALVAAALFLLVKRFVLKR